MVRSPSVDKNGIKKGAWSEEEDNILRTYIERYGHSNWRQLPKFVGLARCGKSCRLRWLNYLKPGLKKGIYSKEEEELIIKLREELGNKWSIIASKLPGRTDNEIKNYWHTHLRKRTKQDPKPELCESRQKPSDTSDKIHLPDQYWPQNRECCGDDNSFPEELYDSFWNEPFLLDYASNTMISPSGSCNSTFTEPSGSFLKEPFSLDATNSLISPSSSCNSTSQLVDDYKILQETIPGIEASNSQVFPTNCEESITGSASTEPFWLSTFYQVLSSSSMDEEFNLPFSQYADDGYDLFNHSWYNDAQM